MVVCIFEEDRRLRELCFLQRQYHSMLIGCCYLTMNLRRIIRGVHLDPLHQEVGEPGNASCIPSV